MIYPANVHNRLFENVQDIRQSHKIHHGSHEAVESEIDNGKKNFIRGENPERHFPGRCSVTIIIHNSNDTFQLYTKEVHLGL